METNFFKICVPKYITYLHSILEFLSEMPLHRTRMAAQVLVLLLQLQTHVTDMSRNYSFLREAETPTGANASPPIVGFRVIPVTCATRHAKIRSGSYVVTTCSNNAMALLFCARSPCRGFLHPRPHCCLRAPRLVISP